MKMRWTDRIASNPGILAGKPAIAGTRISVELILDQLASGWSIDQILESYPRLSREDVLAALAFSADVLRRKPYVTVTEVSALATDGVAEEGVLRRWRRDVAEE